MNSRERFIKALNHEEADRVPIDMGGFQCSIHIEAYENLINFLNLDLDLNLYDYWQRLVKVDEQILKKFNIDSRYIYTSSSWEFKEEEDKTFIDEWGIKRRKCGDYYEVILEDCPLKSGKIKDILNYPFPDPEEPARFIDLEKNSKKLYEETDYALVLGDVGGVLQGSPVSDLVGWENYLMYLAMNQDFCIKLADVFLDWWARFFDKALDACGDYVELVWLGDDWGTQDGPIMDPKIFRKIFKPRYKELINLIRSKTNAKIAFHSCGSIKYIIEDFIEIGVDVLNPVQVGARDMDTKELKKDFGDRISFLGGGVDTQSILNRGTPEEVESEVKRRISDLAPGGGYIFATVHNILAEVPPENIISMYKAVAKYGNYPIKV